MIEISSSRSSATDGLCCHRCRTTDSYLSISGADTHCQHNSAAARPAMIINLRLARQRHRQTNRETSKEQTSTENREKKEHQPVTRDELTNCFHWLTAAVTRVARVNTVPESLNTHTSTLATSLEVDGLRCKWVSARQEQQKQHHQQHTCQGDLNLWQWWMALNKTGQGQKLRMTHREEREKKEGA